jgi:translation elongation factor EF-Ts
VLRLAQGQAGRVDAAVGDGRAALVKVVCQTDFAARTEAFRAFATLAADAAVRHGNRHWETLTALEPRLDAERRALSRDLKETVEVAEIALLAL